MSAWWGELDKDGCMSSRAVAKFLKVTRDKKAPGGVRSRLLYCLRKGAGTGLWCLHASIFAPNDPNRSLVEELVLGKKAFGSVAEERAFGVMYGMLLGDAIGARVEFMPVDYNYHEITGMGVGRAGNFDLLPGQWTDDSSMGLCLADSLLATHGSFDGHDCMHRFLAWWDFGYDNAFRFDKPKHSVGLGGNISMSLSEYVYHPREETAAGDKRTSGNGSVMRNAAVPVCFHDDHDAGLTIARRQSLVTHQGEEAAECCRLITHVAILAMNSTGSDEHRVRSVLSSLGETFQTPVPSVKALAMSQMEDENPDRDWRWKTEEGAAYHYCESRAKKQPGYVGSYAMDATAMALHCVWSTHSFTEAVLKAVNMCGDADSVGAVTGQLAGAFYGFHAIPLEWIKTVSQWDGYETGLRAYRLFHKIWWNVSELEGPSSSASCSEKKEAEGVKKEVGSAQEVEKEDGAKKAASGDECEKEKKEEHEDSEAVEEKKDEEKKEEKEEEEEIFDEDDDYDATIEFPVKKNPYAGRTIAQDECNIQ